MLLQATVVDVERIHKSGKLVAVSCIENGYVIGRDLSLIERHQKFGALLYHLGARWSQRYQRLRNAQHAIYFASMDME